MNDEKTLGGDDAHGGRDDLGTTAPEAASHDVPSCGYAFYGPPALCTCGRCIVDENEMAEANRALDEQIESEA